MSSSLYLNLGAGDIKLPGFLGIDLSPQADMQLDLTKKLPWPDGSVAGIYSEHFIEHLSQAEGIQLLHECRRVLKPGGIFRVATPDLVEVINDYVNDANNPVWENYGYYWTNNRCERLNLAMREWGHKWLFDKEELVRLGTMVGFSVRAHCELGQSSDKIFRNLETRDSSRLIIEFQKPDRTLATAPTPLVSIVIPSYNPAYFAKALESAISQTYRNTEIVICDDCRTDEIKTLALAYAARDPRIRYLHNPERLKRANMMKCFDEAQGEFLKFLNDDDELAPNCVERMLECFAKYPDISLVTSRRQRIDENGAPLPDTFDTIPPVDTSSVIEGVSLGSALLSLAVNFVGEPTTVMFRKRDLMGIKPDFMSIDGRPILAINDVAMWLHLAMKGNTIYLTEPLSRFRIHPMQAQHTMREELVKAFPENLRVMRYAWSRFGFPADLSDATIKYRPLSATHTDWQHKSLQPPLDSSQALPDYELWLNAARIKAEHPLLGKFGHPNNAPLISVVIATQGAKELLDKTLASIKSQLRAADQVLVIAAQDSLVSTLSDSLLGWTLLLCEGDVLEDDALLLLEQSIARHGTDATRIVYFDHDEIDAQGAPHAPNFKPDFNYDLLLSYPYMGRTLAVRTSWARAHLDTAAGHFNLPLAYRLALQAYRETGTAGFVHLPALIAHLSPDEPTVFVNASETWQELAQIAAAHLEATVPGTQLIEGPAPGTFHRLYPLTRTPLVSIVIPTRDQLPFLSRCIESLLEKTNYPNFEVLVVDNDSQTPEAQEFLAGLAQLGTDQFRVLQAPGAFNFSRMNNLAVNEARGEFILMLNNDTAALQPDWLTHMVRNALRDDVGIVGARLLYPDGRLQHAGVVLGLRGPAEHPFLGLQATDPGYLCRAQVQQNFSAVTAACLLVSKSLYQAVDGLDETTFGVSYNDVDFCLRVGQTGKRIVWTPLATVLHEGSASQKNSIEATTEEMKVARFTREQASMYHRWPKQIANDPAYNPNLSLAEHGYEIETNTLLRFDKLQGLTEKRVLAFAADVQGCGQYRILQPLQAMLEAGYCTGGASPEMLGPNLVLRSGADTLVFQRPNDDISLDILESLIPLKGIKKIYEVDDNLSRVPLKSAHHQHMPKDLRGRIAKAIGLCDRLVVSTEALAHELAGKCGDTRVILNRLSPAMWGETPPHRSAPAQRSRSSKPRVGWAGGAGHQGDLEMIAEVIRDLADQVDWIFFGMCPDAIRPYVHEFHEGVPTLEYPKMLMAQDWDLAIAPLEVNPFNECKSNLKLLEYGWCGVPVVCSDVTPYQGSLPATRVKNRFKDWRNAITERIADLEACRREGLALQAQVARDWTLTGDNLRSWYEAWTD